MPYLLIVTYRDTGNSVTLGFPTAFSRGLHMILLASQPVDLVSVDR